MATTRTVTIHPSAAGDEYAPPPPADELEAAYWAYKAAPGPKGSLILSMDEGAYNARYGRLAWGRDFDLISRGGNVLLAYNLASLFDEHGPKVPFDEYVATAKENAKPANRVAADEDPFWVAVAAKVPPEPKTKAFDATFNSIVRPIANSLWKDWNPDAAEGTVGSQTLKDLPHGEMPKQLVPPFLSPVGPTILYGPGGTGKGMTSVWLAHALVRQGIKVMVIDYEHNDHEWGRRARGLGYTEDELDHVVYRSPYSKEWTAPTGALSDVAEALREDCDKNDIGYLIVDSYTAATSTGDAMGGQASAQEFFNAITKIGRLALVIAHVAGAAGRFPDKPFGSVFVRNYARETWAVEQIGQDEWDPSTEPYKPHVINLELRNTKMNNGAQSKPQFLTFSFYADGTIEANSQLPAAKRSAKEHIEGVLSRATKPLTVLEIQKTIRSDTGEAVKEDTIRKNLERHADIFHSDNGSPIKWTLRGAKA